MDERIKKALGLLESYLLDAVDSIEINWPNGEWGFAQEVDERKRAVIGVVNGHVEQFAKAMLACEREFNALFDVPIVKG